MIKEDSSKGKISDNQNRTSETFIGLVPKMMMGSSEWNAFPSGFGLENLT